ncbi:hypothetical protein PR202_gb27409 [Eleusine coracana subsp. coracana]|uniref:F-box domain-containing protein n=1 Tax=Eleusine coracana subsp. coracana TaxID=191504 RepID=A0AAV5FU35_ELECO|nr:hypothetical protein PR202_gb27409 [Eleusine coracana subsp. coracana]
MAAEAIGIAALPEDVLAGVLGVLSPRSLAVGRCVCKAWRGIVDAGSLLPHLLPRSVYGIFINYIDHHRGHLFSRPCSKFTRIDGLLSFMLDDPGDDYCTVLDHCNGLLLCETDTGLCVCNPAMQRWTQLPRHTVAWPRSAYIAFDPTLSSHYEVFLIRDLEEPKPADPVFLNAEEQALYATFGLEWLFSPPETEGASIQYASCRLMEEWPPLSWTLVVFSSRTGQWEHRFSLSNHTYQVIKTPAEGDYLGRSMNEVLFGEARKDHLRIWTLIESSGQPEWLLKYQCHLQPHTYHVSTKTWKVEEGYQGMSSDGEVTDTLQTEKGSFHWDSDNDETYQVKARQGDNSLMFDILGFHRYKEVIFLAEGFDVMAYHLSSSKFHYVGYARPKSYYLAHTNGIYEAFVYTPCLIGELAEGDTDGGSSSVSTDDDDK